MRVIRAGFVVAVAAGLLVACLFPSLDGLSGAPSDAGDASVDAGSDTSVDASSDAPTTFCATVDATFCEDFDATDGSFLSRWTTSFIDPGNTVDTTTSQAVSSPRSLVATVPDGGTGAASVWKDLPDGVPSFLYSFDIRFEPYGNGGAGGVLFGQIEVDSFDSGTQYTSYRWETYASSTEFQAHIYYPDGGSTLDEFVLPSTFAPNRWYHVDETLVVSPPPAHVTILVDGTPALATTIAGATNGVGPAEVLAGIYHTQTPTGAWTVYVDDVVVVAQ